MTHVVILDCGKAGLIGGPFAVWVVKDDKVIASRSGILTMLRAEQVRDDMRDAYGARKPVHCTFDQRCNWQRAMRLNFSQREPATFADLRRFYRNITNGQQYGLYSGYAA